MQNLLPDPQRPGFGQLHSTCTPLITHIQTRCSIGSHADEPPPHATPPVPG